MVHGMSHELDRGAFGGPSELRVRSDLGLDGRRWSPMAACYPSRDPRSHHPAGDSDQQGDRGPDRVADVLVEPVHPQPLSGNEEERNRDDGSDDTAELSHARSLRRPETGHK